MLYFDNSYLQLGFWKENYSNGKYIPKHSQKVKNKRRKAKGKKHK